MANTIWKFPLEILDEQKIIMPYGARILSVGTQWEKPVLWALVDEDAAIKTEKEIYIRGTGHTARGVENMRFVGTILLNDDSLVLHIFEKI